VNRSHIIRTILALPLSTFVACGGGTTTVDSNPSTNPGAVASITVAAPRSTVMVGETIQLTATAKDAAGNPTSAAGIVWSVGDIVGGDTIVGTIDATGRYTAPGFFPAQNPLRISATAGASSSISGSATVGIAVAPQQGTWIALQPRALNSTATGQVLVMANAPAGTTRVELVPSDGGAVVPFAQLAGTTLFQGSIAASRVVQAYQTGDLHAVAGFLDFYNGAARSMRINVVENVRDATVPDVAVTERSSDVQRSAHVVNIRFDSLFLGGGIPTAVPRRFYALFGDDYDFLAVIEQVNIVANRNYQAVRNSESGCGATKFDRSASVGSLGHILGMIDYPTSSFFDLGETGSLHEIGHRWMSYLAGANSGSHWAVSDVAYGIMGVSLPGGEGGAFPFTLTPAGGDYTVRLTSAATHFNDLELYLMGLAPASEVGAHFVFQNQNQSSQLHDGGVLLGPVTPLTINDVIASAGPRVPAYGQAQTSFTLGTIVLSYGRLLTREEMAYFDFMAARGEATTPLRYTSGLAGGTSLPFVLATNGRGHLSTTIR
jgi:hypothetical protein